MDTDADSVVTNSTSEGFFRGITDIMNLDVEHSTQKNLDKRLLETDAVIRNFVPKEVRADQSQNQNRSDWSSSGVRVQSSLNRVFSKFLGKT